VNGATVCALNGSGNSNCWIRLWNRDPDDYMANAFVVTTQCASCGGGPGLHIFDNADAVNVYDPAFISKIDAPGNPVGALNGYTTHSFASVGGPGQINNGGIIYVSDYMNDVVPDDAKVGNAFGAGLRDLPTKSPAGPEWMIAPVCGMKSELWNFGGTDHSLFGFYASVKADWFPINPVGADQAPGGGDDDARFDFTNFNTVYLVIAALNNATALEKPGTSATYRARYRPGSFQRSTILAGYGAPGGVSNTTICRSVSCLPVPHKYFGLNVGIEAANRLELEHHADKSSMQYEYYKMYSTLITYNPKAVQQVTSDWGLTRVGGSVFQSGGANVITLQCHTLVDCQNYKNSSAVELIPDYTGSAGINTTAGYISVMNWVDGYTGNVPWEYLTINDIYSTTNGNLLKVIAASSSTTLTTSGTPVVHQIGRQIPGRFGQRGFAKIKWNGVLMSGPDKAVRFNNTAVVQDGIDSDPESWAYMMIFKTGLVANAPVGTGTEFKVTTFGSYTTYEYLTTNGTFDTAGTTGKYTNAGPATTISDDTSNVNFTSGYPIIVGGVEKPNRAIRHRGGGGHAGSFQAWNVGICIQ